MTETVKMKAPAHYLRVDLDDPGEAEYWLVVLDAPRRVLEAAIAAVGRDALEVRRWLEGEASFHSLPSRHPRENRDPDSTPGGNHSGSPLSRG